MRDNPNGTQAECGAAIGLNNKGSVNKRLQRLKTQKLVFSLIGHWKITAKGEKSAHARRKMMETAFWSTC